MIQRRQKKSQACEKIFLIRLNWIKLLRSGVQRSKRLASLDSVGAHFSLLPPHPETTSNITPLWYRGV